MLTLHFSLNLLPLPPTLASVLSYESEWVYHM